MYRTLDPTKIVTTLKTLEQRIDERFPRSGLSQVCQELIGIAELTASRAYRIARPNIALRLLIGCLLAVGSGTFAILAAKATTLDASTELSNVMQGIDAGVSLLIVLGGAAFYLSSLESRWRRAAVLKELHGFRSIAHVIDMHQLTKDPSALGGLRTSSSPDRSMTRYELVRYLSYCSEMLSLTSKCAAVYGARIYDPTIADAVGDIERLTTNISQKIWQKITLVGTNVVELSDAAAVPAGRPAPSRRVAEG